MESVVKTALVYLFAGLLFGFGLLVSGMASPDKVLSFLSINEVWNPALLFVLGSAVPTHLVIYLWFRKRGRTLDGGQMPNPVPRPINLRLIIGAAVFGVGWGLVGLCPGPALTRVVFMDASLAMFLLMMFVGFELERRVP